MRRFHTLILSAFVVLALSACGSSRTSRDSGPLLPFPEELASPNNEVLRRAVKDYLKRSGAPVSSHYEFKRADLNGDGLEDALVLFKNPFGHWCGTHGCTMLIMKAGLEHFTAVNIIKPIRPPLYISRIKTNGWKDLIIRVSGRAGTTKNVALHFDGRRYPTDPERLPPYNVKYVDNLGPKVFP